jgi:hypothetical protein
VRPERDALRSGYLGFSLEPMFHIVPGSVSTRGKQIVCTLGDFIMGRLDDGMTLIAFLCPNRPVGMN